MEHRDSCPAGPLGPLFGECNCPANHDGSGLACFCTHLGRSPICPRHYPRRSVRD
jgi:hypothetical protein